MVKKGGKHSLTSWAFLIGVIIALVLGFLGTINATWTWILVIIGLVVGFLNVSESETHSFLWSGIVLIIASSFGQDAIGAALINGEPVLSNVLQALLLIFVPATIVVAVKNSFNLARH